MWMWRQIVRKARNRRANRKSARAARACGDSAPAESRAGDGNAESGAGCGTGAAAQRGGATTGMTTDLQRLAVACNKAADHYCAHPKHAGPDTIVDLYRAMAALAAMLDNQMSQQPIHAVEQKHMH